jgi:hypothetical protein
MRLPFFTLILSSSLCVTASETSIDQISRELAEIEQSHRTIETVYTVSAYAPRAMDPDGPWSEGEFLERHRTRWISHNERVRLELRIGRSGEAPAEGGLADFIGIWTGEKWVEQTFDPIRQERIERVESRPDDVLHRCDGWFNVCPWFSGMTDAWSLGEVLGDARVIEQDVTDSEAMYELLLSESPKHRTLATLQLRLEPEVTLRRLDIRMIRSAAEHQGTRYVYRTVYRVVEWRDYGDLRLPALAHRDAFVLEDGEFKTENGKPVIARTVYKRISAEDRRGNPPPAELFAESSKQAE